MGINDFDSVPMGQILRLNFFSAVGCNDESTGSSACRIGQSGEDRVAAPKKIVGVDSLFGRFSTLRLEFRCLIVRGITPRGTLFVASLERLFFHGFRSLRSEKGDTIRRPPTRPRAFGEGALLIQASPDSEGFCCYLVEKSDPTSPSRHIAKRAGGMSRVAKGADCKSAA